MLRCRELLFGCESVLASPSPAGNTTLLISPVVNPTLDQILVKMKGRVLWREAVNKQKFESCLRYTLQARLAPQWNRVGALMVHGRAFSMQTTPLEAAKVTISVSDEDICLSAESLRISLPALTMRDLNVNASTLQHFLSNEIQKIGEHHIASRWCHNLPSMKKGQIVSVTRQLPAFSPFKSYKDLKRYWKNMYGYRLDENEPPFYINVSFRAIGGQVFTYPPPCLKSGGIVYLNRVDPRPVLTALLRDIYMKSRTVCDKQLIFSARPSPLSTLLYPSSQVAPTKEKIESGLKNKTTASIHR